MLDDDPNDALWWLDMPAVEAPDDPAVAAVYDAMIQKVGVVPNMVRVLSNSPALMLNSVGLANAVMSRPESELDPYEKELIAVVVSVENRCDLCVIGHSSLLRKLTGKPYQVGIVEVNFRRANLTTRERALAEFAVQISRASAEIEPSDLERLRRDTGLSDNGILEATCVAAYFNWSNRVMSALGIKPQKEAYYACRTDVENSA